MILVFSAKMQQEASRGMMGRYLGTVFPALSILLMAGNLLCGVLASGRGDSTGAELVGLR